MRRVGTVVSQRAGSDAVSATRDPRRHSGQYAYL